MSRKPATIAHTNAEWDALAERVWQKYADPDYYRGLQMRARRSAIADWSDGVDHADKQPEPRDRRKGKGRQE